MAVSKKRAIVSLDNLSGELKELVRKQYPAGYEGSITRIMNAKKEPIFVFPLETDEATYLVKIPATKNSDGEYDVESSVKQEFDDSDDDTGSDDFSGTDIEGDGDGENSKDPSYEPDFDN
ncbi:MAG: hypothetical protein HC811_07385 [Flammeovirgaceae bacterium]|nr:hypothetical protein [Flammeovirgaceae bacterium]